MQWAESILLMLVPGMPVGALSEQPASPPPVEASAAEAIDKSGYTLFHPTPHVALRDFTTDRPDATESPFTVDAGHMQIEVSLAAIAFAHDGPTHTRMLDVLPVNLKVGLTNTIDVQLLFTPYQRVLTRDAGTRDVAQGFGGDTELRLKINLWGDDSGRTALAVMPFVKLPTGSAALGNGHAEGGVIVPLAIDLPAGFSLGTMLEFDLSYDDARRDYGVDLAHSATLGHALIGRLSGYVEYIGVVPRAIGTGADGRYRAIASTGLTYGLAENWNIDAGATFGLSGETDDAAAFVGTSLRF